MCSISEIEQAGDNVMPKKATDRREKGNRKNFADEGSCMKCPEKAAVLVRNNDPFCRTCFLEYVVHKFRATIGKARVIHQGQRVLLAVSGGSASCAMLDLVIKGLDNSARKKHRFQPGVVHIDDEGLCGNSLDKRKNVKHHIEELVRSVGFPYHNASLADLFVQYEEETSPEKASQELVISNAEQKKSNETPNQTNRLRELFQEVMTVTAQEDLLSHLYRNLLQRIAKNKCYDYVMVGDCGSNIAVKILADVAQGRGSQLPLIVGFKDNRSEVPVLRPMREFTKKEILFYNCFNDITSFSIPSFATKASSHGSVNRLTEELIFGLQAGFPSTVSTVLKTGDKIASNVASKSTQDCVLCLAPLGVLSSFSGDFSELPLCDSGGCVRSCQENDHDDDTHPGKHDRATCWKMSSATGGDGATSRDGRTSGNGGTTSHSVTHTSLIDHATGNLCDSFNADSDTLLVNVVGDQSSDNHNILNSLCYGCTLTYHDIKNGKKLLPKFVTEHSTEQFQRRSMMEEINGFMLDG